jgi:hypothetical protein
MKSSQLQQTAAIQIIVPGQVIPNVHGRRHRRLSKVLSSLAEFVAVRGDVIDASLHGIDNEA